MKIIRAILPLTLLLLASCASKKDLTKTSLPTDKMGAIANQMGTETANKTGATTSQTSPELQRLAFVQKVSDNQVYAQNIVGNMTFSLTYGDKDISAPGALRMRRDAVIRLQLFVPILGSEIGRIDFTPEHVLIVDRLHKEYIQADYNKVAFLQENGINFYTLQSLFWNQLFMPGQNKVGESDLKKYSLELDGSTGTIPLTLKSGKMTCTWNADGQTGQIVESNVEYTGSSKGTSSLNWKYDNFTAVGAKMFPSKQTFSFSTTATQKAQKATVDIKMNSVKTDDDWDATTTVSSKYKKVDVETILKKITSL